MSIWIQWLQAVQTSAISVSLRTSTFAYPLLEILHIAGLGVLIGTLSLVDLRVLGVGSIEPNLLARNALRLTLAGFALAALTGLAMLTARPVDLGVNPAFFVKMGLLVLAGANAALFHLRGGVGRADGMARTQAVLSLMLWLAVIAAGRMIAYV
jgi:hypothetical protein